MRVARTRTEEGVTAARLPADEPPRCPAGYGLRTDGLVASTVTTMGLWARILNGSGAAGNNSIVERSKPFWLVSGVGNSVP